MIGLFVGGWLAACAAALAAAGLWRVLGWRMESVARACHELRGPLTAARLGLELGARTGELSPARLRAIDLELGRAALALQDLDTTRARHSLARPALEQVDLTQLLRDSAEAWQPAARAGEIQLDVSWLGARAIVWGDRLRLAQAIGNLIANAIEHGGGVVEVRGRTRARRVFVEVIDGGAGLPAPVDELVRRARRGRGRRGRGLAISQAVAASHGGRLAARPSDRGACLVLELPAAEPRGRSSAVTPAACPATNAHAPDGTTPFLQVSTQTSPLHGIVRPAGEPREPGARGERP
jgi:signal transduction histidine kinase